MSRPRRSRNDRNRDRTGIIKRFMRSKRAIAAIEAAVTEIDAINHHQYDNRQISEQTRTILTSVKTLKEQDNGI